MPVERSPRSLSVCWSGDTASNQLRCMQHVSFLNYLVPFGSVLCRVARSALAGALHQSMMLSAHSVWPAYFIISIHFIQSVFYLLFDIHLALSILQHHQNAFIFA